MWHVWETGEVRTGFWWGETRWKTLGIDGRIILILHQTVGCRRMD